MLISSVACKPSKALYILQKERKRIKGRRIKEIGDENKEKEKKKREKKQNAYDEPPAAAITPPTPRVSFLGKNVDIDA